MGNDNRSPPAVSRRSRPGGPNDPESPAPLPKRRRIALACSACRVRKSRCNGVRPRCAPCERMGFECIYELPETSANYLVPKDVFSALELRVRLLEAAVKHHEDRLDVVETDDGKNVGRPRSKPNLTPESGHHAPTERVVVNVEAIQDPPTDHSMTDGMAISFVDEQDCGFFGPSSNIAFMRHIFRAMAKSSKTACDTLSPLSVSNMSMCEAGMISVPRPSSPTLTPVHAVDRADGIEANLLPPHSETDKLIRAYFSNTGLLFPFIHEETFLATYETMMSQGFRTTVRRTWLGLLNMVLAMAVCTTGWAEDAAEYRTEQSDVYYRRARELCKTQMLRGTTLETVQYLLLTSQYLQGTQRSVQTWTTHGLAVRAALSIGLHSADTMTKFSPIEQEMRRRTWFGCVILDRSLSMTFGRPGAIPEDYVKVDLPKPIPPQDGSLLTAGDSSVAFFTATILLYRVVWKIMGTLYGHNLGFNEPISETLMITHIFQLEQELVDWQTSLPAPLFIRSSSSLPVEVSPEDHRIERFRLILTLRYLNAQLLLHRPSLTRLLGSCTGEPDLLTHQQKSVSQVQANCNRTCVAMAEDIIEIIHTVLSRRGLGRNLIGAWWFTLYYTFNAALSIFGSLLLPMYDHTGDHTTPETNKMDRGKQFLEKAVEALVRLDAQNVIINRCIDYLRQLIGLVNSWTSSSQQITRLSDPSAESNHGQPQLGMGDSTGEVHPDLFVGAPLLPPGTGFEDELELGQFFAPEFQKWFERLPT